MRQGSADLYLPFCELSYEPSRKSCLFRIGSIVSIRKAEISTRLLEMAGDFARLSFFPVQRMNF
jgi:hypothetical protein